MLLVNKIKNDCYIQRLDNNTNSDWDEIYIEISVEGVTANAATKTVSLFKPIRVFLKETSVRININLEHKAYIKIINIKEQPVYLRHYRVGRDNDFEIKTSDWDGGYYKIIFSSSVGGSAIAYGRFSIHC